MPSCVPDRTLQHRSPEGDRRGALAAPLCLPLQPPHEPQARARAPSWDQASHGSARGRRPVASCSLQTVRPFLLRVFGTQGRKGTGPRSLRRTTGCESGNRVLRGRPPLTCVPAVCFVVSRGLRGHLDAARVLVAVITSARSRPPLLAPLQRRGTCRVPGWPAVGSFLAPPPLLAPSLPPRPGCIRPTRRAHTLPPLTAPEPVTPGRGVTQGTRPEGRRKRRI